jgi:hypothetical protein
MNVSSDGPQPDASRQAVCVSKWKRHRHSNPGSASTRRIDNPLRRPDSRRECGGSRRIAARRHHLSCNPRHWSRIMTFFLDGRPAPRTDSRSGCAGSSKQRTHGGRTTGNSDAAPTARTGIATPLCNSPRSYSSSADSSTTATAGAPTDRLPAQVLSTFVGWRNRDFIGGSAICPHRHPREGTPRQRLPSLCGKPKVRAGAVAAQIRPSRSRVNR